MPKAHSPNQVQTHRLSQTSDSMVLTSISRRYSHIVVDNASESIHCKVSASFVAFSLATFMWWLGDLQSPLMPMLCARAIIAELIQCNFSAWPVAWGFVVKVCLAHILRTLLNMFNAAWWLECYVVTHFFPNLCLLCLSRFDAAAPRLWPTGLLLRYVHA